MDNMSLYRALAGGQQPAPQPGAMPQQVHMDLPPGAQPGGAPMPVDAAGATSSADAAQQAMRRAFNNPGNRN